MMQASTDGGGGPASRVGTIVVAGRAIRLVRPADPDRLLDDPKVHERNRVDDYMPYWAYLWPGAYLLAEAIAAHEWTPGVQALEIGCGLGLAGLVGLSMGLRVHFTDYDDAALDAVARSAGANGFDPSRYSVGRLDWRDLPARRYPLIFGADVLYERKLVPLVADVLAAALEPGGFALLADPYRAAAEDLPCRLDALGLTSELRAVSANTAELGPIRGTIRRIWRPGAG